MYVEGSGIARIFFVGEFYLIVRNWAKIFRNVMGNYKVQGEYHIFSRNLLTVRLLLTLVVSLMADCTYQHHSCANFPSTIQLLDFVNC